MSNLKAAAQQALEALDKGLVVASASFTHKALRAALAEPEPVQEPVAWLDQDINCAYTAAEMDGDSTNGLVPLYTAPPQRPLLTDEEINALRCLQYHKVALQEWLEKTEWVQQSQRLGELGMHRADVMRRRLKQAEAQRDVLLEALKGLLDGFDPYAVPEHEVNVSAETKARAAIKLTEG